MFPPIAILTAGASSAREPISRLSFSQLLQDLQRAFFVSMTSLSFCSNAAVGEDVFGGCPGERPACAETPGRRRGCRIDPTKGRPDLHVPNPGCSLAAADCPGLIPPCILAPATRSLLQPIRLKPSSQELPQHLSRSGLAGLRIFSEPPSAPPQLPAGPTFPA